LADNVFGKIEAPKSWGNREITAGKHDAAHAVLIGVSDPMTNGRKLDKLVKASWARG
jgi:hypothetical protein